VNNQQHKTTGQAFNLSILPATRVETHRQLGVWLILFASPFCAVVLFGCLWAIQSGEVFFAVFGGLFLLIPSGVALWGLNCLLTRTTVTIDSSGVRQLEQAPWKDVEWQEPLSAFRLQIKVHTSSVKAHEEDLVGHPRHTFHIRLSHKNDLRSIELFETDSKDDLAEQFRLYQTDLTVKTDGRIRDFNTDEPIDDLSLYGLAD